MEASERAVVVEHGGKSFLHMLGSRYGYPDAENLAVNGQRGLEKAPGDPNFFVFDGKVETLQRVKGPRRIVTKYDLREDLRGAAKAEVVSVDAYRALSEADQGLYRPVHEDIPQTGEDIPFVVQPEGGAPYLLPKGVVCTDQNYYARFPGFWHLGPVRATAKYVLWRTAKRLDEIIRENRYIKWSSGWGRDIDDYLNSPHRDSFFIEVLPMTVNGIEVKAQGFHTMFTTDAKERTIGYARVVGPVDAVSLDALERVVSVQVESLTAQVQKWTSPDKCPCCQRKFKPSPRKGAA